MNRLKRVLLAGTIVPSLVLAPFAGAFAQGGEQERHAPGGAHGGGPGGPGHGEGGPHGGGAAGAAHAPAEHAPAEHTARPPSAAPAAKVEHAAPPARAERPAPVEHAAPAARAAPAAPAARAERPNAPAAPHNTILGVTPKQAPAHDAAAPSHALPPAAPGHTVPPTAATRATPPTSPNQATPRTAADPAQGAAARRAGEPGRPGDAAGRPGDAAGRPGDAAGRPGDPNHDRMGAGHPGTTPGARPGANPAAAGATPGTPAATPGAAAPNAGQNAAAPNGQRFNNGQANGFNNGNNNNGNNGGDRRGGISPGGAAAIGAAAGFAGGFLAATAANNLDGIRRDRREQVEDGRTYIREPGRTIIEDGDRSYIVHDENDRFRDLGYDVRRERRGSDFVDTIDRPDGTQILTFTTPDGRMLRRVRRYRDGREFVLIDNSYNGGVRSVQEDIVDLPPPPIGIPRDRYDVAYQDADEGLIYDTFTAPPLQAPPRRYTLDQIRYSPDVRRYVRSVDINTINFDSGSWTVPASATGKLRALASAVKRTVAKDPNTVFLVQGYTDATGNATDNLSLSDRRAQSVAAILSKDFGIPPENLTTQGYGQQNLKENTQGPSAANRRVVIQNITPLLAAGGQPPQ
jgi:outer membrane protein OmpA-like peptidoglycan-associated protein